MRQEPSDCDSMIVLQTPMVPGNHGSKPEVLVLKTDYVLVLKTD